ncbi:MAG: ABC transporter ATP-binding protein [Clostridiaceae bacterium]|nr:ABC transporter ATP-binding protein [Clostridiaceae bacterium]
MNKNFEIEVVDLVKKYKELVAVDHLNLSVYENEIFGLLGPNGSGKSTLINCILALLRYDQGKVYIFGEEMTATSFKIKQKIGYVPQDIAVYEELTVQENIDYFCGLYIFDKHQRKQHVDEAIDFTGLDKFRKFVPSKLSGGLLRRLNLACGIAHKPKLIFLDEPTVAVDPQSRNRILEGIEDLRKQGSTIVYTTHYMEEVEMLCDRLVILDQGQVLVTGSSEEIISNSSLAQSIDVVIFDLTDSVLNILEQEPEISHLTYQDAKLSFKTNSNRYTLLDLLNLLEEHNLKPVSVSSEKPTLNDVFLEITGKELKDNV